MGIKRVTLWLVLIAAAATALAGCGGSGSSSSGSGSSGGGSGTSAERTKLEHQLSVQTATSSLGADLSQCLVQQAGKLPIDQLREVSAKIPSPAAKRLAVGLVSVCVGQGKGLAAMHSLIIRQIESSTPASVPPAFKQCLAQKADATTGTQLSKLVAAYAEQNPATAQAQAHAIGVGLGRQCLNEPKIIDALRTLMITPIKTAFKTSSYSAAFKNCVLKKADKFPAAKVREAALNQARAEAVGEAFGSSAAKACIAEGAKP